MLSCKKQLQLGSSKNGGEDCPLFRCSFKKCLKKGKGFDMRKNSPIVAVESLESRRLLSAGPVQAYLSGSQLYVNGSSGADTISVNVVGNADTQNAVVKVTNGIGKTAVTKTFRNVTGVTINGGAGNDTLKLSGTNLADFWFYASVDGGKGNDNIILGRYDGGVGLFGGTGNDTINASQAYSQYSFIGIYSNIYINGGAGNDDLTGSTGNDYLAGGDGDDILRGNAGDDTLNGGRGRNIIRGGEGDDTIIVYALGGVSPDGTTNEWNAGGWDTIQGGGGDNTIIRYYNSNLGTPRFGDKLLGGVESTQWVDYAAFGSGDKG